MPNIDIYLHQIATAVYGEDMRSAIHDALNTVNGGFDDPFDGASISRDGTNGVVPAPKKEERLYFLRGDGKWAEQNGMPVISDKDDTLDTPGNSPELHIDNPSELLNFCVEIPGFVADGHVKHWTGFTIIHKYFSSSEIDTVVDFSAAIDDDFVGGYIWPTLGKISSSWTFIESYNGEVLPEGAIWVSNMDDYDPEGTPSTGAEVAYTAPQTYHDPESAVLDEGEFTPVDRSDILMSTSPATTHKLSVTLGELCRNDLYAEWRMGEGSEFIQEIQMVGATESSDGDGGTVPWPSKEERNNFLRGDGTWAEIDIPEPEPGVISYSTEEQYTNQNWVDGNKIYQKTYVFSTPLTVNAGTGVDISSYITNTNNIDKFIKAIALDDGASSLQCCSVWLGYTSNSASLYLYCAEGITITHLTIQYTKVPDSNDRIIRLGTYGGMNAGSASHAFYEYTASMWRGPNGLWTWNSDANNSISASPSDKGAITMWNTYTPTSPSAGGDPVVIDGKTWHWIACDISAIDDPNTTLKDFVPYCVGITANAYASVTQSYPTMKIQFSQDGSTWDTVWEGVPRINAGKTSYFFFDTTNHYSKIRLLFDNGTGYGGSEWTGCLALCQIYGKAPEA